MSSWGTSRWGIVFVPGGLLFAASYFLFQTHLIVIPAATLSFCYAAVFLAGLLFAWRFHSGRILTALVLILLAHRAVEFFAVNGSTAAGSGRTALESVACLLVLDLLWVASTPEFGFTLATVAPGLFVLFFESVFVAVVCRPQTAVGKHWFNAMWLPPGWFDWTRLSQPSFFGFAGAFIYLLIRVRFTRKQSDAGFAWAVASTAFAFSTGGVGYLADGYIATAGLLLLVSVVETSYGMAYRDELTGIPSRRAFKDSASLLQTPYAVAVVDIDHFKAFNDTYGHETGDEVLRMVSGILARVSGGGKAFRIGGEEFAILFPGKALKETLIHLEELRRTVESTSFRFRGADRRAVARGAERRTPVNKSGRSGRLPSPSLGAELKVTVSIGVASDCDDAFQVTLGRADKALYRSKQNGRNRVEVDGIVVNSSPDRARTKRVKTRAASSR